SRIANGTTTPYWKRRLRNAAVTPPSLASVSSWRRRRTYGQSPHVLRSAPTIVASCDLRAPGEEQHRDRDEREQRQHEESDRRPFADVSGVDAGLERPGGQHLRGVERAAVREDERHDHVGCGEDDPEEDRDEGDRELERQRDVPELPEPGGAVDRRCI